MAFKGQKVTTDIVIEKYVELGGNMQHTANFFGISRGTVGYHIKKAGVGSVADGRITIAPTQVVKKPRRGKIKRFICSAVQNNTLGFSAHVNNCLGYAEYLRRGDDTCDFFLGTFSYNLSTYGAASVKRGQEKTLSGGLWYEPSLEAHFRDEPVALGEGLLWSGNQNILPTAADPLRSLERYRGRRSLIVPHVKQQLRSVAAMQDEDVKFLYTTGGATQRNYIQKRAGIIAEEDHTYGAILVEIDSNDNWWCRQLVTDEDGVMYDVGPSWADGCIRVVNGEVDVGWRAASFQPGDVHVREMAGWVNELFWGEGGLVDTITPSSQFFHDLFSMSNGRGHHDRKSFEAQYLAWLRGQDSVEDEIAEAASFLSEACREDMETYVVRSNHDRHLERWLDETDHRKDPLNAEFYLQAQLDRVRDLKAGRTRGVLERELLRFGVPENVEFLPPKKSFVILKECGGGIECALHGDSGVNGSRGTTRNLRHVSRRINKGHDHTAYLDQHGVASAGACAESFEYEDGPHTHSLSAIVTYQNSARTIITPYRGAYRA